MASMIVRFLGRVLPVFWPTQGRNPRRYCSTCRRDWPAVCAYVGMFFQTLNGYEASIAGRPICLRLSAKQCWGRKTQSSLSKFLQTGQRIQELSLLLTHPGLTKT